MLQQFIQEVNDYTDNLMKELSSKISLKIDQNIFEKFKENLEENVSKLMRTKLNKHDHEKAKNFFKSQYQSIKRDMNDVADNAINTTYQSPFLMTNNKCITCNRDLPDQNLPEHTRLHQTVRDHSVCNLT